MYANIILTTTTIVILAMIIIYVSKVTKMSPNSPKSTTTIKERDEVQYKKHSHHSNSWIFIHYHKTGFELVTHFSTPFKTNKNCSLSVIRLNRKDTVFHKSSMDASITLVGGPDVRFNWVETFSEHKRQNVQIVHFVRDPFDMVLSGFLYHSEMPPPAAEPWILSPNHDVCDHNKTFLMNVVVPKLAESISSHHISHNINELRHNFTLLHKKCEKLQLKYNNMSYSSMLQSARKSSVATDGLFLEAMRTIFVNHVDNRGDMLRMAMNAMYEDKRMSKRVFTSQFPIGDKATFLKTTAEIFDFLMPDSDHNLTNKPFWQGCITKEEAVKRVEYLAFVPKARTNITGHITRLKQHITAGFVNITTRANYMSLLASDPEIAPILNLVRNILLTVHN